MEQTNDKELSIKMTVAEYDRIVTLLTERLDTMVVDTDELYRTQSRLHGGRGLIRMAIRGKKITTTVEVRVKMHLSEWQALYNVMKDKADEMHAAQVAALDNRTEYPDFGANGMLIRGAKNIINMALHRASK